jgi:hypothetical protein
MDRETNSKLEKLIMDMLIQKNNKTSVYSKKHQKKESLMQPNNMNMTSNLEEVNLNQYLDSHIKKDEGSLNSTIRVNITNTLSNSQLLEQAYIDYHKDLQTL